MSVRPRRILLIQTAFVGDLLLGIPLLKRLRKLAPEAHVTLYCRRGLGDFLVRAGLVDHVIEVDKGSPHGFRQAREQLVGAMPFDWVICPHQSLRTQWLVCGLRAARKTGYHEWWNSLVFNERIHRPMDLPEALRQLALLAADDAEVRTNLAGLGGRAMPAFPELISRGANRLGEVPEWASMTIAPLLRLRDVWHTGGDVSPLLSPKAMGIAHKHGWLQTQARIAFLAPGSVWPTKRWREEGYVECARALGARGMDVAFLGAPDEKDICERLAGEVAGAKVIAGETSLYESAELLALGEVLICNDSGAMHMAAAAGLPSVAVFGPTTLDLGYRPWQTAARVAQVDLPCRPCGKHGAKQCPLGTHQCMVDVRSEEVVHEAEALLTS